MDARQRLKFEEHFIPEEDVWLTSRHYKEEESCLHTPDKIQLISESLYGDDIINRLYDCQCDKRVQSVYRYSETKEK